MKIIDMMRADSPVKGHSAEWHFYRSYVGTALWSSHDDDDQMLDANYDISDLSDDTREKMLRNCASFYARNRWHIHCEEREDFEAAARAAGWTRNQHNGYYVAPVGSETRMAEYDDWEDLCADNDIDPIVIPGAPLSNDMEGSTAAREAAKAGHDFWLNHNGHGAGFWDGDWPEPAATVLDKAARKYREMDLFVIDSPDCVVAIGHI